MTAVPGNAASGAGANSMGVEIVSPSSHPADDNGGLKPVAPENTAPLPAIESAAPAPDAVNDINPATQPAAQAAPANGKKPKPEFNSDEESSSKHKKKTGLKRLNPL